MTNKERIIKYVNLKQLLEELKLEMSEEEIIEAEAMYNSREIIKNCKLC